MMYNASFFLKYKLHHLLTWLLVLGAWYYLRMDDYPDKGMGFTITLIKVIDLALLIYITNYLLIPKLLYKKQYVWFVSIFIVMVAGSSILKMNIIGRIQNNPLLYNWSTNWKGRIYDNMIPHFFLVTAGVAVKLLIDYGRLQTRMAETAKEKAEAELNFLKSQINPHFVFNSLNSVYFLIDKNNPEARNALHKFSEMLRYQLYEMNGEKVPVEKEVRYLKDYVDLQQLRKDEKYAVEFSSNETVKGFSIEPLLLVPLVENAFKHISHHTHRINYVQVNLNRHNGHFHFQVKNSKENQPTTEAHGGIGLQNVKRRLELLYPGKHDLAITETASDFEVQLKIQL
jgi:two-component system, LytTR family, sensor kinase